MPRDVHVYVFIYMYVIIYARTYVYVCICNHMCMPLYFLLYPKSVLIQRRVRMKEVGLKTEERQKEG